MNKYRIRLDSGRVIGPFNIKDYAELVKKHDLTGLEEYQIFPIGDWKELDAFPELEKIYQKAQLPTKDDTFMINLKEMIDTGSEIENSPEEIATVDAPREFQFEHEDPFEGEDFADNDSIEELEVDDLTNLELDNSLDEIVDKTRVVSKIDEIDHDKTVINPNYQKYLAEKKKQEEEERKKLEAEKKAKEAEVEIVEPDYNADKTEFVNIKELKRGLESAIEIEEDFAKLEKEKERERKRKIRKKAALEVEEEIHEEAQKSSLGKILVTIILSIVFVYLYIVDEEPTGPQLKPIEVTVPQFQFPMRNPVIDTAKAKQLTAGGLKVLKMHKHLGYIAAAKRFVKSLENNFDKNEAASRLIFVYSELLKESKTPSEDTRIVYSLVQYFKKNAYEDPDYASAIANFYYQVGKYNAAINILDRYLVIDGHKPTLELFAVYLNVLTKVGDIVKADNAIKALEKQKVKDLFVLKSMYGFYKYQNSLTKQLEIIKEVQANPKLSQSVFFLLEKAELFLKDGDLKELRKLLFQINNLNAEGSREYYARYLKLMGLYYAAKKDYKKAINHVQKSMKVFELPELVGELALTESTSDSIVNEMIKVSKVKILNKEARKLLEDGKLNKAFKIAAQSSELIPGNIDTVILLSKIQIAKGYYDDAQAQLFKLYDNNRDNMIILYELTNLYIEMHKFRKAEDLLQMVEDKSSWEYASSRAKLYREKGDFNLGINWLVKAININQLDEENIFALANFYMRFHKYDKAKMALNKVMDLDPFNVNYKISYAKILYEVETAASAIGYLYDVMKDFKDNPQILSEIGIYYYRSGQIKNYQNIKEKLTLLSEKDTTLYRFMIETAKLDDDFEKVVEFAYKVVQITPGDLATRIYLAEVLMGLRRFKEAKSQLDEIKKRFENYPRLSYFYAKFYLLINDIDQAIGLAEQERKENPGVVDGAILLGDIYKKKKEILKAREYYLLASQIDPKSVEAVLGLAYVAFHTNQYDLALDQYQKAINMDELRAESYKLIGDVYKKLGRTQQAVKNYKHFLELSPNSRYKSILMDYIQKVE